MKKYILELIKSWFSISKPDSRKADNPDAELEELYTFHPMTDSIAEENTALDRDTRERIASKEGDFWKMGFHDGRLGISKEKAFHLARHRAEHVKYEIEANLGGQVKKWETRSSVLSDLARRKDRQLQRISAYREGVEEAFHKNPRKYSIFMGCVYLFFALFLILADIPLALRLTLEGFNLPESGSISEQLFYYPIQVFKLNWEVFLLSIGIAFCTIYVKIFWDEYMARPLEYPVTRFKDLYKVTPEEVHSVRIVARWRFAVKLFVLVFTLSTIFLLGYFRYQTKIDVLEETLPGTGIWVFIAITLLFPIIGGICASLGLNYFGNYWDRKRAAVRQSKAEKIYLEAASAEHEARLELETWTTKFQECQAPSYVQNLSMLFASQYDHGYQCGWLNPAGETSSARSLHSMAATARGKLVARGILETQLHHTRTVAEPDATKFLESFYSRSMNGRSTPAN